MDTILQAFLTWQFIFFCIAIGAVVFIIRQFSEFAMANWWPFKNWDAANPNAKFWREFCLPVLPIILGCLGSYFATEYPYPESFPSTSGRFIFGLVAGFSSSLIVKLYNAFLASKVSEFSDKVKAVITSIPTPAPVEVTPIELHKCDHDHSAEDKALEESVRASIKMDQ